MIDVDGWNALLEMFLEQLVVGFPERAKEIKMYLSLFRELKGDPRTKDDVLKIFMTQIAPHAEAVRSRNEEFFLEHEGEIKILNKLGLSRSWNDQLPAQTKEAVWAFLEKLMTTGAGILAGPPPPTPSQAMVMPPGLMGMIGDVGDTDGLIKMATEVASKMIESEGGGPSDPAALASIMKRMLGQ